MKKFAACLLTMAMLLSMMTPAFAETTTTTGSITINNTVKGQTYSLYKLFDLESYDGDNFSYKVCEEWKNFFASNAEGAKYIVLDNYGYIESTTLNDENKEAFAKAALAWAKTKNSNNAEMVNPCDQVTAEADGQSLTFEVSSLGYYLVDSTLGTLCTLNTNVKNLTIEDKNQEATLSYKVKTDADSYEDVHHTDIISTLNYKIEVSAKPGAQNYQIFVKKPTGIDETIESIKVSIQPAPEFYSQEQEYPRTLEEGKHYEILSGASSSNDVQNLGYDFGIAIDQVNVLDYIVDKDAVITITYQAETNAKVSYSTIKEAKPNTSTAWMSFGTTSVTEAQDTSVYTYHLPIFKYTGENTPLSGAEFILYRGTEDQPTGYAQFNQNGEFSGWTEDKSNATTLVSGSDGMINLYGLSIGEYYLKETGAPNGYNRLIDSIEIQISAGKNHVAAYAQDDHETDQINVLNNTGSQLPSTGGMGTKIFYALGATMFLSAIILLVVRKRMSK